MNNKRPDLYSTGMLILMESIDMGEKDDPVPDYSKPRAGYQFIILVNSKTRYRTNNYNDALTEYYALRHSAIVIQLIDVDNGTICEDRPLHN
jgi:hypothetical protein